MRIVFFGTPAAAACSLEKLAEKQHVVGVVSQPDRPAGRGHKVVSTPVKCVAEKFNIPVLQPDNINQPDIIGKIREWLPDVIIVVAFGQILKEEILAIAPLGCINAHFSLLPKYRGAAPVTWSIVRGEQVTGVHYFRIVKKLDAGDVLWEERLPVRNDDNAETLGERLANLAAGSWDTFLDELKAGKIKPAPQDHSKATYAPKLKKNDGLIDWSLGINKLDCFIRGMFPYPKAFTCISGENYPTQRLIIHSARPEPAGSFSGKKNGEIVRADENGIFVTTIDGIIKLESVQPENGRVMSAPDFVHGHQIKPGYVLG